MMSKKTAYLRYCRLIDPLQVQYHRGYRLRHVLASEVAMLAYGQIRFGMKSIVKFFAARKFDGLPCADQGMLAIIGPHYGKRREYQEIMAFVTSSAKIGFFYSLDVARWKFHLSLGNLFEAFRLAMRVPALRFRERMLLWAVITEKLNSIDVLDSIDLGQKSLLAFSAVHSNEAMFVEYFHKRDRPTFSLHHGAYGLYRMDDKPIDMLAYDNLNADYHLCWGQFTKDEFMEYGIAPDRLLVAGYPRVTRPLHPVKEAAGALSLVFFCARWKFDEQNQKIIQMLSELLARWPGEFRVAIKPHPSLNFEMYREAAKRHGFEFVDTMTIGELLQHDDYHVAITCNSNAYYDAYLNNRIALRYVDETNELTYPILGDDFTDAESLHGRLQEMKGRGADEAFWNSVRDRLTYHVGYGVDRYGEFLDSEKGGAA